MRDYASGASAPEAAGGAVRRRRSCGGLRPPLSVAACAGDAVRLRVSARGRISGSRRWIDGCGRRRLRIRRRFRRGGRVRRGRRLRRRRGRRPRRRRPWRGGGCRVCSRRRRSWRRRLRRSRSSRSGRVRDEARQRRLPRSEGVAIVARQRKGRVPRVATAIVIGAMAADTRLRRSIEHRRRPLVASEAGKARVRSRQRESVIDARWVPRVARVTDGTLVRLDADVRRMSNGAKIRHVARRALVR